MTEIENMTIGEYKSYREGFIIALYGASKLDNKGIIDLLDELVIGWNMAYLFEVKDI